MPDEPRARWLLTGWGVHGSGLDYMWTRNVRQQQ
jgi:hypothetical protein